MNSEKLSCLLSLKHRITSIRRLKTSIFLENKLFVWVIRLYVYLFVSMCAYVPEEQRGILGFRNPKYHSVAFSCEWLVVMHIAHSEKCISCEEEFFSVEFEITSWANDFLNVSVLQKHQCIQCRSFFENISWRKTVGIVFRWKCPAFYPRTIRGNKTNTLGSRLFHI